MRVDFFIFSCSTVSSCLHAELLPDEGEHPERAAPEAGEVEEGGAAGAAPPVPLRLDLPLLVLEVEDGAPLRVVQRGRPVERAADAHW